MAKNVSIVSLSLNPEMDQRLKRCAKQKGDSVSKVVRDLNNETTNLMLGVGLKF